MIEHGTMKAYSSKKTLCRCDRCRAAARKYQQDRRKNDPTVMVKARIDNNQRKEKVKAYVRKLKNNPCTDCGVKYPYYVMQFDHIGIAKKSFVISEMRSIEAIDEEIKKCELVCANCHAIRTHTRRLDNQAMV